jgi:phage shock protein A
MASFTQRLRTFVKAEANDLLTKTIDENSIPMLKQYVRDLEDGISKTTHEAAAAAASITTLTRKRSTLNSSISRDTEVAKAYLSTGNEAAARQVAERIHTNQGFADSFTQQITTATEQSKQLDRVVEQLNAKHTLVMSRLDALENTSNNSRALAQATQALKSAQALTSFDVNSSVDNAAERITAKNDLVQEEFKRTVAGFDTPSDPVKDAEVDSILNSLRASSSAKA